MYTINTQPRINTHTPVAPQVPMVQNLTEPARQFGFGDVSDCGNVNEVLEKMSIGDYSQECIKHVCQGYSLIKDDLGNPISIVSDSYNLLQPIEAFAFLDALKNELGFTYSKAGFSDGGKRLSIECDYGQAEISTPDSRKVGDILKRRVIATTSFDGTSSTKIQTQALRVWCSNGMANWKEDGTCKISVRHTKNQRQIMADALTQATGIKQAFVNLESDIARLERVHFTREQMDQAANLFYKTEKMEKITTRVQNQVDRLNAQFHHESLGTFGRSAMDAMNAFTAFQTHDRVYRNTAETSREENQWKQQAKQTPVVKFRNIITDLCGV